MSDDSSLSREELVEAVYRKLSKSLGPDYSNWPDINTDDVYGKAYAPHDASREIFIDGRQPEGVALFGPEVDGCMTREIAVGLSVEEAYERASEYFENEPEEEIVSGKNSNV
jgi:hypothetical protein